MVVLTDDERRENEGDLVLPAQCITPEAVTFMLQHALGYLCLCLTEADCDRLRLAPQAATNTSVRGTAFTVSIDLHPRFGGTTGVSAKERAKCIQMAIDPKFGPEDFVRPGHVNPLRSRNGGVLVRTGQTEGSVDLCRLAGLYPAAVLLEIMKPDGEMARVPDLEKFCAHHGFKMCSVAQIIEHRLARESLVERLEPKGRLIRTAMGDFTAYLYKSIVDPLPHLALTLGDLTSAASLPPPLVRMHRRHLLGDVFLDLDSSSDGPTGDVLRESMRMIQREGRGAIVYLRSAGHEGSEGGVIRDLEGRLQTIRGASVRDDDTPDLAAAASSVMPQRELGVGCQILRDLGLHKLRLITNNTRPLAGIEAFGVEVVERVKTAS